MQSTMTWYATIK